MTSDGLLVIRFLFSEVWLLFTTWHIPGTAVTPASFAVFLLAASLALRRIKGQFGDRGDDE